MRHHLASLPVYLLACLLAGAAGAWLCVEAEAAELMAKGLRKGDAGRVARADALRGDGLRLVLSLLPLFAGFLALLDERVRTWLRAQGSKRVLGVALGVTLFTFLALGLAPERRATFDPYQLVILLSLTGGATLAGWSLASDARGGVGKLTGAALLLWLALWIPFDLRWLRTLWPGPPALSYATFALWISALAVLGFGVGGRDDLGLRAPAPRDGLVSLACLLAFGVVAIPLGLGVGFLEFNPTGTPAAVLLSALAIGLTVALPEELFFRGVLDARLRASLPRAPWLSLAISSLAFGIMHWNNASSLGSKLAYFGLATVAGVVYGLAYRRSGGLWAAVGVHTLTDVVWRHLLHR